MKNHFKILVYIIISLLLLSCKVKHHNYITYYNRVNEIDSILRYQKDSLRVYNMYKKLFKKFEPKNQFRIEEFETYVLIANKLNKGFGGKKALNKLIELIAEKEYFFNNYTLFKKYNIDSVKVRERVKQYWEKTLNKVLVDSFRIAFTRDQKGQRLDIEMIKLNDKKNSELFKWTLRNYGFPSVNKIGLLGQYDDPMGIFLLHLFYTKDYLFFKNEFLKYIDTGELKPADYAAMVDRHDALNDSIFKEYAVYRSPGYVIKDSVLINNNRKKIGLPTLKHWDKIVNDYWKKGKVK